MSTSAATLSKSLEGEPKINWIKNDPAKHQWFDDRSKFLIAVQVHNNRTGETKWEFSVVVMDADGDGVSMYYEEGDIYDAWSWDSVEYFAVLEGKEPSPKPEDEE